MGIVYISGIRRTVYLFYNITSVFCSEKTDEKIVLNDVKQVEPLSAEDWRFIKGGR